MIKTPIDENSFKDFKIGDEVKITGTIYTLRDAAHKRLLEDFKLNKIPLDLKNSIIYYVGPSPKVNNEIIGSCGPTTSSRMDLYTHFMLKLGVKMMIGKGNRSEETKALINEYNGVYAIAVGGAAVYLQQFVKSMECIAYDDLGSEAIYKLEVENFPVFIAYDLYKNSIFERENNE